MSKLNHWKVAVLACALALSSCAATSNVTSVRDPHYDGVMHLMFVAINLGLTDPAYSERLSEHLTSELARHQVTTKVYVVWIRPVDQKALAAAAERVNPDGMLVVRVAHGVSNHGTPVNLTYEVNLLEGKKGDRVWNATIETGRASGVYGDLDEFMALAASQIVNQLAADRLIEPAPPLPEAKGNKP